MTMTKEDLQERAQLVRIHEANCKIEFPTAEEANFRLAMMKKLGVLYGLKEMRNMTVTGPVTQPVRPPPPAPEMRMPPVRKPK